MRSDLERYGIDPSDTVDLDRERPCPNHDWTILVPSPEDQTTGDPK